MTHLKATVSSTSKSQKLRYAVYVFGYTSMIPYFNTNVSTFRDWFRKTGTNVDDESTSHIFQLLHRSLSAQSSLSLRDVTTSMFHGMRFSSNHRMCFGEIKTHYSEKFVLELPFTHQMNNFNNNCTYN